MHMAFSYSDEEMVKILRTLYLRSSLEYATAVGNPHKKKNTKPGEGAKGDHRVGSNP